MTEEEFKKNAKTIPTNIETEEKIALDYFKYKVLPTTSGTGFESKEEHYTKIVLNVIEKLKKENEELRNTKNNCPQFNTSGVTCKLKQSDYIPKDKIREKIETYQNEIECEKSYLEQGIICEEEYKDRIKVYNSYIFILNKLLEEE